jgi:large subunit ribosomal protein L29
MEAKELRDLNDEELQKQLQDAKEELFNLRFQLATGQLDNPMKLKDTRRTIAKVETVRRERELAAVKAEG